MYSQGYGIIGNSRTAALVSAGGSIDWLCFPSFDSPSVFSKIMDPAGGNFGFIVPEDCRIKQGYVEGSEILDTQFYMPEGSFQVLDFMPRYILDTQREYMPAELYRYIRLLSGKPRFSVVYRPVMNYARYRARNSVFKGYAASYSPVDPSDSMFLYSDLEINKVLSSAEIRLRGEAFMALSYYRKLAGIDIDKVWLEYERTLSFSLSWREDKERIQTVKSELVGV